MKLVIDKNKVFCEMIIFIFANSSSSNSHLILQLVNWSLEWWWALLSVTWQQYRAKVLAMRRKLEEQCFATKPDSGILTPKPGFFTKSLVFCILEEGVVSVITYPFIIWWKVHTLLKLQYVQILHSSSETLSLHDGQTRPPNQEPHIWTMCPIPKPQWTQPGATLEILPLYSTS